jgi:hypothetical protein
MNEFKHEIMEYELSNFDEPYIIKIGKKPVIITAVHTMKQNKAEGVKPAEMFTNRLLNMSQINLNALIILN